MSLKSDSSAGQVLSQQPLASDQQDLSSSNTEPVSDAPALLQHEQGQQPSPPMATTGSSPANVAATAPIQPMIEPLPPNLPTKAPTVETFSGNTDGKKVTDSWNVSSPCVITAVLYKEAALDSPTFRASMNHMDNQLNYVDKWLESFTKSLSKLSSEMDGMYKF